MRNHHERAGPARSCLQMRLFSVEPCQDPGDACCRRPRCPTTACSATVSPSRTSTPTSRSSSRHGTNSSCSSAPPRDSEAPRLLINGASSRLFWYPRVETPNRICSTTRSQTESTPRSSSTSGSRTSPHPTKAAARRLSAPQMEIPASFPVISEIRLVPSLGPATFSACSADNSSPAARSPEPARTAPAWSLACRRPWAEELLPCPLISRPLLCSPSHRRLLFSVRRRVLSSRRHSRPAKEPPPLLSQKFNLTPGKSNPPSTGLAVSGQPDRRSAAQATQAVLRRRRNRAATSPPGDSVFSYLAVVAPAPTTGGAEVPALHGRGRGGARTGSGRGHRWRSAASADRGHPRHPGAPAPALAARRLGDHRPASSPA